MAKLTLVTTEKVTKLVSEAKKSLCNGTQRPTVGKDRARSPVIQKRNIQILYEPSSRGAAVCHISGIRHI